ncbi:lipoprotein [Streptomyces cinereoruber]|uniref:Lipoprotein n=1 Tax=Streptomyces cinereoruber TaxID=67260 RepID=A0AAV4KSF0_9ACTN|nr:peptidoglycan/xylan/chitin deacetylase (PgdA/CDA1 family) [Streptomyces cinereoruber]NIH62448.1 peptidoglycan/xylan/chitin deacetylase (PgdA/CDA1 family) [Streptomyces cinereoruber]GGR42877.1 lipoprotein [Streptomyces cinereoruber]
MLGLLGAALVGCGEGAVPKAASTPATGDTPSPRASTTAAARPKPGAEPAAAPTMAPGPNGLTPVYTRRAASSPQSAEKVVALTFDADMTADQGPRAARGERFDNPELIATLRRLKVDATVFMTGRWAEEYPDQARSIGGDPLFEIANHSYSHYAFASPCYGLPTVAGPDMAADVRRAFDAFRDAGAVNVVPYFRFPGGCYDDAALRSLGPAGVTAVQWDVVGGDAFAKDADAVAEQVLDGVRPGSLVVLHCTRSAAPATERAIRRIVPELRARGYRFVKVSELMRG